jgi:hypothetical protein
MRVVVRSAVLCLWWAGCPSCCAIATLLCPPAPPVEADFTTPEAAYETFKRALEADDAQVEFQALSRRLKDEQDLSFFKYQAGRGSFLARNRRELELFLSSRLQDVVYAPDRSRATLVLSAERLTGRFTLVNEPEFVITTEEGRLEGDTVPVSRLVRREGPEGRTLTVSFEPEAEGWPTGATVHGLVVRNRWRFLEVLDVAERPFPLEEEQASRAQPRPRASPDARAWR